MSGFDSFAIVDWSAGNDTGPKPKRDAVWACAHLGGIAQDPVYLRNRDLAFTWLCDLIETERSFNRRLLIGFDFPFGYPTGFARKVTGSDDPFSVWAFYGERLMDTPKGNNRFALAGQINSLFPGIGPFWFNAGQEDFPHLPRKGRVCTNHGMKSRRKVEELAKGTFTCWQLGGAGAVGGQVMTGLRVLHRLQQKYRGRIAVWPFEDSQTMVHFVEIWPSLIDPVVRSSNDPIRDRAQVRLLVRALANLSAAQLTEMMEVNAPEEGWILGLGYEVDLLEAACRS